MDVLVLSCGTGGGHNAAGEAVLEELLQRGHHAKLLNPYTLESDGLAAGINKTYIRTAQGMPRVFGAVYRIGDLYQKLPFRSPVYYVNKKMGYILSHFLERHSFDVVVMSHLFAGEILSNMKLRGLSTPKTVYIATDYTPIPFTGELVCDRYVIPAEELQEVFTWPGVSADRIVPLGIPVSAQFGEPIDQKTARSSLGLSPNRRYFLLSGGDIGAGSLYQALQILLDYYGKEKDIRFIVICGNNRRLYEKLTPFRGKQVLLLRHTARMAEYMKACDLLITKPGGLSSTEAAASGTALIHISPIPGCEPANMEFFSRHGMSLAVESLQKELIPACDRLLRDDERQKLIANQKKYISPHAAADICDMIEHMI